MSYRRVAALKTADEFTAYLDTLGVALPFDEMFQSGPDSPLARPYHLKDGRRIGNRFCAQPMEGWDATPEGLPSELTLRRWANFGRSGAKLIWGCEAVAVRPDGRANPNQLLIQAATLSGLERLRSTLVDAHRRQFGTADDLLAGLQLTHSGRFARPEANGGLQPKILYHHPVLDPLYHLDPNLPVLSDGEIEGIIADFGSAARRAQAVGFDFVDLKHCHGYLGHEFLSAFTRPGHYGGPFENRTRFLCETVSAIRRDAPGLRIGVRLSAFDLLPFRPDAEGTGRPVETRDAAGRYPYAFGCNPASPLEIDLSETVAFLELLRSLEIELVNLTAGSPYYNPHIQRPAYFPPSDGYRPPEDPLAGVARQIGATAELKAHFPDLAITGSGYTYLQDWLPNVAQAAVRRGRVDFVGLGRMLLAYPELPADLLAGRPLDRRRVCRTFSDCTTAPRRGLFSGCYPLDEFYKARPEAAVLKALKKSV